MGHGQGHGKARSERETWPQWKTRQAHGITWVK